VWNAYNTVFGSKRSAVCAQAVYFLHSTKRITWLSSRWWLAACDWVMSALTRIGRRKKFGEVFFYGVYRLGNDCELIPTVDMKARNPVQGYFGNEFPAVCNYCGVMAAWSRKSLNCFGKFLCVFFVKTSKRPLTVKFSKFCSERFCRDTDRRVVFKLRNIWPTGNLWNRTLLRDQQTKFRLALQLSLLGGLHPKYARVSPWQCIQSAPDFIQIG